MNPDVFDIVIANARILTSCEGLCELPYGMVCISGDRIARVILNEESKPGQYDAIHWIDAGGDILMPGLINTHTHMAMTLLRGLADDLSLMEWLNNYIFPVEAKVMDEEFVYWGSVLACAEMIRFGTTAFCDGYFFEDMAFRAAKDAGLRAICGQGVVDFPSPDLKDPERNIERAVAFVEGHLGDPLVRPGIFCHSPYTCSPETLIKAKDECRRLGVPFFIHLAETKDEVEEIRKRYGQTPVRHLDKLGILDEKTIAVHCIWVDEEEIDILVDRNVRISVTTEGEMKLASGIAPLPMFLRKGALVGLGTDGPASNNNLDLFGEMSMTAKLHKVRECDPTVLDARSIVYLATEGGARVMGIEGIGKVEENAIADLILIDINAPHLQPLYHPLSQIVYSAKGSDVRTTIVGGRILMRDRRLQVLDEDQILSEVERLRRKILE